MQSRSNSAHRVEERYRLAADEAVPKKWFATKLAELKSLLKTPHRESIRDWSWVIDDKVHQYFVRFQIEFEAMVSNDQARLVIKRAIDFAQEYLKTLSTKFDKIKEVSSRYSGYTDTRDPVRYLQQFAWLEAAGKVEKAYPNIGDVFKHEWVLDEAALDRLVKKTLKKATADEVDAIMGDTDRAWRVKFDFLTRSGFYLAASKLMKKTKLDWSPLGWFEKTREIFEENYAQGLTTAYRNFDLHGMKIVVDDSTVTDPEIREYIGFFNEAHARLKIRGLESAWYGTLFIKCNECGGPNQNTGGGVGGHYFIGEDIVRVYSRPSAFIVELVAHELGHRYWFKQMKPEQRERFKLLVKARTVSRPKDALNIKLFSEGHLRKSKDVILEAKRSILGLIDGAKGGGLTLSEIEQTVKSIRRLAGDISDTRAGVSGLDEDFQHPGVQALKKEVWGKHVDLKWKADDLDSVRPEQLDQWAREMKAILEQLADKALITLELARRIHNEAAEAKLAEHPASKAWQESYLANPAPVEAVSDYGKSDIDEAFAEVFAHYVLNFDITRDQMESFRSVLSAPGAHRRQARQRALIARVASRFLASA